MKYLIDSIDIKFVDSLVKKIKIVNKKKGKIFIVGNGGSISTANHISVDLTKNAKIKTIQPFNSNLITCFSNDYGYENWISKTIEYFLNSKDLVIFLSVSGNSKNLLYAAKKCVKNNFWVNSKSYNQVEIIHFIILCLVVDKIVGREIYGSKL